MRALALGTDTMFAFPAVLSFILGVSFVDAALIVTPGNVASIVGGQITLNCQSDISRDPIVFWLAVSNDGITTTRLSNNGVSSFPSTYTITGTGTPGVFNLQINSLSMSEVGTYRCSDFNAVPTENRDSEVVALASSPVCTTNVSNGITVEGEHIKMTCFVQYSASSSSWAPVISWSGSSGVVSGENESTTGTSQYSIIVLMTPQLDGQRFSCRTYFDPPAFVPGFASNTISYNYTWNSPILVVQYPPYNVQLTPLSPTYNPGDHVTCSAESNPGASFKWKDLDTNDTSDGNVLTIPAFTEGGNNDDRYVCIATNDIKGQEYSIESSVLQFSVVTTTTATTTTTTTTTPAPTTSSSLSIGQQQGQTLGGGEIAGIVLACVVLFAGGIVLGMFIMIRRAKRSDQPRIYETPTPIPTVESQGTTSEYASLDMGDTNLYENQNVQSGHPGSIDYVNATSGGNVHAPNNKGAGSTTAGLYAELQ